MRSPLYYSGGTAMANRWDIFCSVVDNFGDAGVCWRLAQQLVAEHALSVRLFVDALPALARMAPSIDAMRDDQLVEGVRVQRWAGPRNERSVADPGAVVIEAFGCGLPHAYLAAMAARDVAPVWINLEYLSAEAWIEGCHGLPSRHPRLPLTRYFFFPGFTPASGGLLREHDLFARRDAFLADASAQAALWRKLGVAKAETHTLVVSIFCYPSASLPSLLTAWAEGDAPVLALVPEGVAVAALDAWTGGAVRHAGQQVTCGRFTLACVPFLSQEDYDRLLWRCDVNFVRGEDSFVRAQSAARPLVWQPYPQAENAHRLKLEAFLARYTRDGLGPDATTALRALSSAWNAGGDAAASWNAFATARGALAAHARVWAEALAAMPDLAENLVKFCSDRV
jgi:uncharacterized repeat protein (TIGR03837 family)